VSKTNFSGLALEVAIEVEEVSFEQRRIRVLVERRTPTEVDRACMDFSGGSLVPARIHPIGRQAKAVENLDVGRWEAEQPATLVALHYRAPGLELATEHGVGPRDVAPCERAPNGRAADRLVDVVGPWQQLERFDVEVSLHADLAEEFDIAVAATAEVKVFADNDDLRVQTIDEHTLNERFRGLGRLPLVERNDRNGVNAGRREKLHLLIRCCQQERGRLGSHNTRRVAIERYNDGLRAQFIRLATDVFDYRLVANMYTVVCPNRDDGSLTRPRGALEIGDRKHREMLSARIGMARFGEPVLHTSTRSHRYTFTPVQAHASKRSGRQNDRRLGLVCVEGLVYGEQRSIFGEHRPRS
jgi:hypothetical protein